jgi:hypothetical protein
MRVLHHAASVASRMNMGYSPVEVSQRDLEGAPGSRPPEGSTRTLCRELNQPVNL